MIAKQYIFTRWFNKSIQRDGFQEYSQSVGISGEDADFIRVNTRYEINRTSGNLPYMPTQEEIETMFPRNTVYFRLPSGKYCLAQTCCATDPVRPGNYFIHAYIFDNEVNFNPLDAIESNAFRRFLTEDEKTCEKAPAPLPEVNVDFGRNVDLVQLKSFIASNVDNFKYLLSAMIYAIKENKRVYLQDDVEKRLLWYKALRVCLPESACAKVTYGTYMCPASEDVTADLRVITSYNRVFVEKLKSRLAANEYVYNFKDGVVNKNIKISPYVDRVVDLFIRDPGSATKFIGGLEQYTAEANGDIELAVLLSGFYAGGKGIAYTSGDLASVIACADKAGRIGKRDIAEILAKIIFNNPAFPVRQNSELYNYVLANGDAKWKNMLIDGIINDMVGTRVPVSDYTSCYTNVFDGMPVGAADFALQIASTCGYDNFVNKYGLTSFAVYALATAVMDGGMNTQAVNFIDRYVYSLFSAKAFDLLTLVLNKLGGLSVGESIVNSVVNKSMTSKGIFGAADYETAFTALDLIKNYNIEFNAFVYMLETHLSDPVFVRRAEQYISGNNKIASALESIGGSNHAVRSFMENCAVARFNASTPDEKSLDKFYRTYYDKSEEMKRNFVQGLSKYMDNMKYGEKSVCVLTWLKKMQSDRKAICPDFKMLVDNTVCNTNVSYADYKALYNSNKSLLRYYDDYLKSEGKPANRFALTLSFADELCEAKKNKPAAYVGVMKKLINEKILIAYTNDYMIDALAEYYADDFFALYLAVIEKEKAKPVIIDEFVECVMVPLSNSAKFNEDNFVKQLKKMPKKNKGTAIVYLLRYITAARKPSTRLSSCVDAYFNALGKGKGKKFIEEILTDKDNGSINKEVKAYLEKVFDGNKGLLSKICDIFKPKKNN